MGRTYRVVFTRDMVATDADNRQALYGQVDYHTRTIRVYVGQGDRQRKPDEILETLLHEMIHPVLDDNKLMKAALKDGVEENFVDNLANVLADTLMRNHLARIG
jgi:hypothetical protein